jgi:hypothetical protein
MSHFCASVFYFSFSSTSFIYFQLLGACKKAKKKVEREQKE